MMMYVGLVIGFILLVKGADYFVDGASNIATKLKVSQLIIGLTIVAFGTSAPEAAVSITSALQGQNGMAIGNVVGSNIFNVLIVVGLASVIYPLNVDVSMIKKEIPFTILGSLVLFILTLDPVLQLTQGYIISRGDGLILLSFFSIFMYSLFRTALSGREETAGTEEETTEEIMPIYKSGFFTLAGLVGVVLGGQMVVEYASAIATQWGMSETLIGLTIVAFGTSLPELVTSILAARKGHSDLALGNIVGSNIFNLFFILGITSTISPLTMEASGLVDMGVMIATIVVLFVMTLMKRTISRIQGIILVVGYAAYMAWLMM